ncbi:regulator of Vps4 activity in the MVB pathway-domain-containing protein [Amylostereum chailletii]|nr:regulator of Vps4 activity in the MVB pathway-domain-containing protein [Amylostereum chailletii]
MPPWNATKAKASQPHLCSTPSPERLIPHHLSLSVQRLRTLQEKKEAQAKASRRDVATLLERGKVETARIKVENIINEDINTELLELLELYCELLIARFGLLDQNKREPDAAVSEGVCSIIRAAPRTELKELHILRDLLMHKYGRDFSAAVMENRDGCVSERVMKKLTVEMPSSELVDAYLTEIAKGYGVRWSPPNSGTPDDGGAGSGDDDGGVKVKRYAKSPKLPDLPPTEGEEKKKGDSAATPPAAKAPSEPEDDFTLLAKRFEALKKR